MSSLVEGYNYDIFISYRQKDNKGEKWVSEFVRALKNELESTFKEEISVYFDVNPHDGLLETHDVDESLKEKLKCLIFIPIISRTYCDPKAFAWEHEFKAFIEQASHDQFGLKVTLPNGNVAGRVLPVRIHDLYDEDIKLCESVLGGVLRGVEFIYREPGVNKPLNYDDDEKKNLNGTRYRIQVNKVANSIEEIIAGIKSTSYKEPKEWSASISDTKKEDIQNPGPLKKASPVSANKIPLYVISVLAILIIVAALMYPKIFSGDNLKRLKSSDGKLSVAVMPFNNRTNDTVWNVWQNGIKDNIINYLSNFSDNLAVKQSESVDGVILGRGLTNYASITPSIAGSISRDLAAKVYISGSISQAGPTIRINAQIVNSKTEEPYKSFQLQGYSEDNVFQMIDSLSGMIKDFLLMSVMEKEIVTDFRPLISTHSSDAYKYYLYGNRAFYSFDYNTAKDWFLKAIEIDTNFTEAMRLLAYSYNHLGVTDKAREWCLRLYSKRENMPMIERLYTNAIYSSYFETIYESIKNWSEIIEYDDQMPVPYSNLANAYISFEQYDKAISLCEKELEIYDNWGVKPRWVASYTGLGELYHLTGQYKKERKVYSKAEKDFPGDSELLYRQAILALSEDKTDEAEKYIEELISVLKINSASDASISESLAFIYWESKMPDKAEEYLRKALSSSPDVPDLMNNLASLLIENDRNIEEAIQLTDKAIELSPDYYLFYWTKGEALYKQGKYNEALEVLQKSWDLQPYAYIYSLHLFIEQVKEALLNS